MIQYQNYEQVPDFNHDVIKLYDANAFDAMRTVGKLAATCLDEVYDIIKPGITTQEIDDLVVAFARKHNLICAPLNYRGFPKSVCTSVNHVICHGIPDNKVLQNGDIINVDVTFILDGWYGDTSRTYAVGQLKRAAERLIEVTHECLLRAIEMVKPGNHLGDIGHAIQSFAEAHHYGVVEDFCGHGIGNRFHELPNVIHTGKPGKGIELKEGMIFTIEPMINIGRPYSKILKDGWTAVTRDRSLSAQYEHTIGVTATGYEIFTLSPKNIFFTK